MTSTFFFFNDTATTEIYTLSLHDALPIWFQRLLGVFVPVIFLTCGLGHFLEGLSYWKLTYDVNTDRKSTRLNSSHSQISYAVFCLKKKKHKITCTRELLCTSLPIQRCAVR